VQAAVPEDEGFVTSFQKFSVEEDTYAVVYATILKAKKAIVSILGTGSNCVILTEKNYIKSTVIRDTL
jgi:N-acetylglucosamine kinase-like BadF-type ATPase